MTSTLTRTTGPQLPSSKYVLELWAPDAQQQKADALELVASIGAVSTPRSLADAVAAMGICDSLIKAMEKCRVAAKERVLEEGRFIDDTAKAFKRELLAEHDRLKSAAGVFQLECERAAQAVRDAEAARQRRIVAAMEQEDKAQRIEAQERRTAADDARLRDLAAIDAAKDDPMALEAAQRQADENAEQRARDVAAQQAHEAEIAEAQQDELHKLAASSALVNAPLRVEGARVRVQKDYEVLDLDALYRARPDLVKLEERRALILAAINIPGAAPIQGIRVFESVTMNSRTAAP